MSCSCSDETCRGEESDDDEDVVDVVLLRSRGITSNDVVSVMKTFTLGLRDLGILFDVDDDDRDIVLIELRDDVGLNLDDEASERSDIRGGADLSLLLASSLLELSRVNCPSRVMASFLTCS